MGNDEIRLFEIARVYLPDGQLPDEHVHLGAIVEGGWSRAKGIVETLHGALNAEPSFERASDDGFFLSIESWDPRFDPSATGKLLESLGARSVELLES